jgi:CubicO group peptidase (beta-lactamase class C family)
MDASHSIVQLPSRPDRYLANPIRNHLQQTGAELKVPSFHYQLLSAEGVIADFFSGYRNAEQRLPATPDTQYALFSVTKTFTALAVLQLAEAGSLRLDEEAREYLPQYSFLGKTTLRHLLAHQSGLGNPLPLRWIHPEKENPCFNYRQFVSATLQKVKRECVPGQKTAYSNLNYLVLGEVIEQVSGLSFGTFIERNIRHKITDSPRLSFHWQPTNRATGYHPSRSLSGMLLGWLLDKQTFTYPAGREWTGFKHFYTNGLAYGGLLSSAGPLGQYLQALLPGNTTLLSDNTRQALFAQQTLRSEKPAGMALGWFTGQLGGRRYLHHAGGGGGFYCEARIYPDAGLASLLLTNKSGFSDQKLLDRFDHLFL